MELVRTSAMAMQTRLSIVYTISFNSKAIRLILFEISCHTFELSLGSPYWIFYFHSYTYAVQLIITSNVCLYTTRYTRPHTQAHVYMHTKFGAFQIKMEMKMDRIEQVDIINLLILLISNAGFCSLFKSIPPTIRHIFTELDQ